MQNTTSSPAETGSLTLSAERENSMHLFLADTGALMRYPGMVSLFSDSEDLLIVPMSVLHELNRSAAALDDPSAASARKAVLEIQKSQGDLSVDLSETDHSELLPQKSSISSGHDDILSIACGRKKEHPTVISDDLDLCRAAASLGIPSVSVDDFMRERRKILSAGISKKPETARQLAEISEELKIIYDIVVETAVSTGFLQGRIAKSDLIGILCEKRDRQNANLLYIAQNFREPFCIEGEYIRARYILNEKHTAFCLQSVRPLFPERPETKGYALCPELRLLVPGHFNTENMNLIAMQRNLTVCFCVKACISNMDGSEVGHAELLAEEDKKAVLFSVSQKGAWMRELSRRRSLLDFRTVSDGLFLSP